MAKMTAAPSSVSSAESVTRSEAEEAEVVEQKVADLSKQELALHTMEVQNKLTDIPDSSLENCCLSPTTICTTITATISETSTPSQVILQRPTTLDLKSKSAPRKGGGGGSSGLRKLQNKEAATSIQSKSIFVRLTSLGRSNDKVITSLALKAQSASSTNGPPTEANGLKVASVVEAGIKYKTPTPVAENAAAAALASSRGHDLFSEAEDTDSLPEGYINSLKLNALIALIILLVVTAVGTAMLLSIAKIWGNHQDNVWLAEDAYPKLASDYSDHMIHYGGHDRDRLLHPKDLSTFLFQYERARRHQKLKKMKEASKKTNEAGQKVKMADRLSMDLTASSILMKSPETTQLDDWMD